MIATFLQGNIAGRCTGEALVVQMFFLEKHLAFASSPYFNNSTSVNVQLVYR